MATVRGVNDDMLNKVRTGQGFIAALDQSGGSTPKALGLYGIGDDVWSNDDEMFDLMHAMRTRIVTSPAFTGDKVLGAILFEQTMDRQIDGLGSAEYLWSRKNVVPFLKVDKGLAEVADGAQVMKPIPGCGELCERAVALGVFGTKMRSVVQARERERSECGRRPAVRGGQGDHRCGSDPDHRARGRHPQHGEGGCRGAPSRSDLDAARRARRRPAGDAEAVDSLGRRLLRGPLIAHPKVLRVVALFGGYPRRRGQRGGSSCQHGMIASFSRALTEGLSADQSDDEFNAILGATIDGIFAASIT